MSWRKTQVISTPSLIRQLPGVGAQAADEEETDDKPSSSLALASDSYSGSGLAIALSGDDLVSKSLVK